MGTDMNDNDHELIERYLAGDMSPAAREAFEDRLRTEPALQEALERWVDVQRTLRQTLTPDPQREALEKTLQSNRSVFHARSKVVRLQRFSIAVASVAAVVAVLLYVSPWRQDLTTRYAAQEMVYPAERGATPDTSLQQAVQQFNGRHYAAAIASLTRVLDRQPDDAYARLYRGLAYMENNQPALARADFEIIYNGPSLFKYDGAFYIAISYLKEKNEEQCRQWLLKIPADAEHYKRAQELLNEL